MTTPSASAPPSRPIDLSDPAAVKRWCQDSA
jgi:hypothetical protein